MKQLTTLVVIAGIVSALAITTAHSQPFLNATWTLNEQGTGSFYVPPVPPYSSIVGYVNGIMQTDPVSGITTLFYNLGLTTLPGDVLLSETPTGTSDLLRFNGNGGVYFFSDNDGPPVDPADVGIPPVWGINTPVTIQEMGPEGNNGALYTPLAGQPGFDTSGDLPNVSYNIVSDVPVPEPNSLLAFGIGVFGLAGLRRLRR